MPGYDALVFLSAAEQGRLIRARELSPLELVRVYLDYPREPRPEDAGAGGL